MEKIRSFRDLIVWRKAHEMVLEIYRITREFPRDERFGLTSQIRKAAVSVPANIVEGFRRKGQRDKMNFYNYSQASLDEAGYYLILAKDLNFIKDVAVLENLVDEIGRLLTGLIRKVAIREV